MKLKLVGFLLQPAEAKAALREIRLPPAFLPIDVVLLVHERKKKYTLLHFPLFRILSVNQAILMLFPCRIAKVEAFSHEK